MPAPLVAPRRRNPWWIPPFFGRVPDVEPRLVRLLGLVALAMFFEQYDLSILTSALKFIAQDLHIAEGDLGRWLSVIRLGALPAFLVVPFADHVGRSRVFLAAVVGLSLGTFLTAFAQTTLQFVLIQMATRTSIVACAAVAIVIVTEEFPAEHRGWGIGMLGALGASGFGLGALLFAMIDLLPWGWRALYAIGGLPLALVPVFRRGVPETARFRRHHADAPTPGSLFLGWWHPLASFAATYPSRAAVLGLAGGLVALGDVSVYQFTGYFTQTVHGWSPGQFSAMVILGGAVGLVGNVIAGRLGDRIGRRMVGLVFLGCFPVFVWLFYLGPTWVLPLAWALFVFCGTSGVVIIRALSTELFPTSHRGTSAGWLALVQTIGWALGLWMVGLGTNAPGDIARMTSLLSCAVLLGGLSLLLLPETHRRELEAISRAD